MSGSRRDAQRAFATNQREQGDRVAKGIDAENSRKANGRSQAPTEIRRRRTAVSASHGRH